MRASPAALLRCVVFVVLAFLAGCSRSSLARQAQQLEEQGRYLEAAAIYVQLLPQYQGQPLKQSLLNIQLGEAFLHGEHPAEAFNAFSRALELDNSSSTAHLRIAQLFIAANSPERAYDHLVNVLGEQPNHPEALAALGGYYVSIGQPARAEQQFQRVLAIKPGQQTVAVALADVYSAANEIEKARGVLANSAAANQGNPMAWLALGRLEEEQGNAEGAESAYRNAVKAEDNAETNLRLAQFLLRTAKIKEAEEALSRADSKKPLQSTWMRSEERRVGKECRAAIQYLAVLQNRLAKRQEPDAQQTAAIAARVIEADLETARGFSLPENP